MAGASRGQDLPAGVDAALAGTVISIVNEALGSPKVQRNGEPSDDTVGSK